MANQFVTKEVYDKDMEVLKRQNEEILEIIKPMAAVFNGSNFAATLAVKFLKIIAMIGAAVATITYLYKLIK